jgi:hypothetical protein
MRVSFHSSRLSSLIRRTGYAQTPDKAVPLLRGWCLVPILIYFTHLMWTQPASTGWSSLCYDLLFELHLFIAVAYHVCPITQWEATLGKLDRALVLSTCALMMGICLHHADELTLPAALLFLLSISLAPFTSNDKTNLIAHLVTAIVGWTELARLLVWSDNMSDAHSNLMHHVALNLAGSMIGGGLYLLESVDTVALPTSICSWHDFFHIFISFVYVHRFIQVRPYAFLHLSSGNEMELFTEWMQTGHAFHAAATNTTSEWWSLNIFNGTNNVVAA